MTLPALGALDWVPALSRPDLLATSTAAALETWAATEPQVAGAVAVAQIDPELADTAALTEAYDLPLSVSFNCVLVGGRREGTERLAGVVVRATTRADVNRVVRGLLDVRKATFLPVDRATAETQMEYGGITPIGLPTGFRVLADAGVAEGGVAEGGEEAGLALIGSGVRRSKLLLPGALLVRYPGVEVVEGLGVGIGPSPVPPPMSQG